MARPSSDPSAVPKPRRHLVRFGAAVVVLGLGGGFLILQWLDKRDGQSASALHFDGRSGQLQNSVIVPTLDTPMPEGKSVIWCSSFQIAWNKLKSDLAGEPVQIENSQDVADRLNAAPQSEADLPTGSYYAAAGRSRDLAERVRKDMARQFPRARPTALPSEGDVLSIFAYLQTGVRFEKPYPDLEKGFKFRGRSTVEGFGFEYVHEGAYQAVRDQAAVLFTAGTGDAGSRFGGATEYAVDLCKNSRPNQIVLAVVKPESTLQATLTRLVDKIADPRNKQQHQGIGKMETLRVPNMHWRIEHRFTELEGPDKPARNAALQGLYIDQAVQVIHFKLDRNGADLASEAAIHFKGGGNEYHFDRPFLLYIKKRDAEHPFLVMWIANDELSQKG